MCCLLPQEVQRIIVRELLLRYFHTFISPISSAGKYHLLHKLQNSDNTGSNLSFFYFIEILSIFPIIIASFVCESLFFSQNIVVRLHNSTCILPLTLRFIFFNTFNLYKRNYWFQLKLIQLSS